MHGSSCCFIVVGNGCLAKAYIVIEATTTEGGKGGAKRLLLPLSFDVVLNRKYWGLELAIWSDTRTVTLNFLDVANK